jgi:hypothetical protein
MFNKTMSFLKVTDPAKRDFLVQELIKTRKAIMQDSITERLGDAKLYQASTKLFIPLTEKIELSSKVLEPIVIKYCKGTAFYYNRIDKSYNISSMPCRSAQQSNRSRGRCSPEQRSTTTNNGIRRDSYRLPKRFAEKENTTDKIFDIHDRGGKFYIGNTETMLDGDNITILGDGDSSKTNIGTPGLWGLIVSKQSSSDIYTPGDLENYQEILLNANALKRNNNPDEVYP